MILEINNLNQKFGDDYLLENVSMIINNNDRIGLVGGNGCGKTTLLRLIVGQLQPQSGVVSKATGLSFGYLAQESCLNSDKSVYQEMLEVFQPQLDLIAQIEVLTAQLAQLPHDSDEYNKLSYKYSRVLSDIDRLDAYNTSVAVDTVLNGMGVTHLKDSIVSVLSGGERTKVELCKLLLTKPQLLILDEPTNHLDLHTLEWLQQFLLNCNCAMLVVSHDRQFLDKVCNGIVEIFGRTSYQYKGNYSQYVISRDMRLALESKEYVKQQKSIAKIKDYIARNKARASTAQMAKSREKTLERMDILELPDDTNRNAFFRFVCSDFPSEKALLINNLSVAFEGRPILDDVTIQVIRSDRLAIIGDNGSGKSTMLRCIVGSIEEKKGSVIFGKNVRLGYYDQQAMTLDHSLTVLEQLWQDNTLMTQTEARSLLAMVGLVGEDAHKRVASLSGGEKARLALCLLMAKDNNVLVLDEPTNHLDLISRESLEQALLEYTGTLIYVSHDRYFVNRLATRVVEIDSCISTEYVGNYDAYLEQKRAIKQVEKDSQAKSVSTSKYRGNRQRSQEVNRKQQIQCIEQEIELLYQRQEQLNQEITSPQVVADYILLAEKCRELDTVADRIVELLTRLERLEDDGSQ